MVYKRSTLNSVDTKHYSFPVQQYVVRKGITEEGLLAKQESVGLY